jgi:hypothetical protein
MHAIHQDHLIKSQISVPEGQLLDLSRLYCLSGGGAQHRLNRVPGFLFSRPNWAPATLPARTAYTECQAFYPVIRIGSPYPPTRNHRVHVIQSAMQAFYPVVRLGPPTILPASTEYIYRVPCRLSIQSSELGFPHFLSRKRVLPPPLGPRGGDTR